jgi:hypothetical protein
LNSEARFAEGKQKGPVDLLSDKRPERKRRASALLFLAGLAATPAALFSGAAGAAPGADASTMAAAANGFYAVYGALPHSGGLPDATARVRYTPLLSPRLNLLLSQAAIAETHFHAKVKDAPPLIEGDLFTSLFEGATSVKLGACSGDAKTGRCAATLTHSEPKQKPVSWSDTLELVNTPSGWKIDDIAYNAGFQFGNTGTLSDTLRMAIAESQ